jgi:hypothetical protein
MTLPLVKKSSKRMGNPAFVKGHKSPSKGRPKGRYSDMTMNFIKLKKIASTRSEEAFEILWEAMKRDEPWAHQIYFRELYSLPKGMDEKRVVITNKETSLDGQIEVLVSTLPEFDEITHDESLNRLKVLNAVKGNEVLSEQTEEIKETRESLLEKVDLIQQIRDLKDKI